MSLLLSPLTWLVLAILVLLFGQWTRLRALRLPGALLLIVTWLAMTPAGANWLLGHVEGEAIASHDDCAQVEWLVVLAGGLNRAPRAAGDSGALTADSLRRVFALLAKPPPAGWRRAISGGGPYAVPEASVMDALLQQLDPASVSMLQETTSQSTWESAQAIAALLPPPQRVALASSALHLPRARLAFEAAGFEVCPWPLDRQFLVVGGATAWLPQSSALRKSEAALHEVVGTYYYRWLAWRGAASSDS